MEKIIQQATFVLAGVLSLALMLFANPAAVHAQNSDNIIINGDFATGNLDNWEPFIADFAGVQATVGVVDGEAAITGIAGTGGTVWHVQLNQILTQAQRDALVVGQAYKITFDARSSEANRPHVYTSVKKVVGLLHKTSPMWR